jgi:hypothetical protein
MSIFDKLTKDLKEANSIANANKRYMLYFTKTIAPLLVQLGDDIELVSGHSSAPRWSWVKTITFDYRGYADNDLAIQPFLRTVEELFGKEAKDWDFRIDSSYENKYTANYHYCGLYTLKIGSFGYTGKILDTDKWEGQELAFRVIWLPPCAHLVEEEHTITSTSRSMVC